MFTLTQYQAQQQATLQRSTVAVAVAVQYSQYSTVQYSQYSQYSLYYLNTARL